MQRTVRLSAPGWIAATLLLGYVLLLLGEYKHFTIWSQITSLVAANPDYVPNPFLPFYLDEMHRLRFLLVWPAYILAHATGIDAQYLFSFMVFGLLVSTAALLAATARRIPMLASSSLRPWFFCLFLAGWLLIGLFMNGRLAYSFAGAALILYAQTLQLSTRRYLLFPYLLQAAGLVLCAVSSGTFTVGFLVIGSLICAELVRSIIGKRGIYMVMAILMLLALNLFMPQIEYFINKNLSFYGYSTARMLLHGPLGYLQDAGFAESSIAFVGAFAAVFVYFSMVAGYITLAYYHRDSFIPIVLLAGYSFIIGLFGTSSLLAMLPALMVLSAILLARLLPAKVQIRPAEARGAP
jgi:hypothetical protein